MQVPGQAAITIAGKCVDKLEVNPNRWFNSTSIVTATCVCKQDTCQIAWSEHAGRGINAPFTWTVGIIKTRRSEMQLSSMQWFVRHPRLTAPNGNKRKR